MEKVTLKIGGRDLELTKSSRLVGVKARPQSRIPVPMGGAAPGSAPTPNRNRLGGFELIDVSKADEDVDQALDQLRSSPEVSEGTHVFHTSDDEVPFVPTGQIYVEFDPAAGSDAPQELLRQHDLQIVEPRGEHEFIVQVTPNSSNPVTVSNSLQESGIVRVAEPDLATPGTIQAFALPSDPLLGEQWHLHNTGMLQGTSLGLRPGADARVTAAWKRLESLGSANVTVAVIDDGFDLEHPDISGDWKLVAPRDFTRNTTNPLPDWGDWHGTACAGVAVGNADGTGIVGAAPGCRLMPVRWGANLAASAIAAWFDYVREQNAWVVSCSWGATARVFVLPTLAARAIEACAREGRQGRGAVICFAAGNDSRDVSDPASGSVNGFATHPDVLAVAASTSRDERSNYSNFGAEIAVCAPSNGAGGWGIVTSDVRGQFSDGNSSFEAGYEPGPYTRTFGGTSSACPLVAGVCALVLTAQPELTAAEVRQIIRETARRIGPADSYDANGHSIHFGYGCVDADAAIAAVLEPRVRDGRAAVGAT